MEPQPTASAPAHADRPHLPPRLYLPVVAAMFDRNTYLILDRSAAAPEHVQHTGFVQSLDSVTGWLRFVRDRFPCLLRRRDGPDTKKGSKQRADRTGARQHAKIKLMLGARSPAATLPAQLPMQAVCAAVSVERCCDLGLPEENRRSRALASAL